MLFRSPVIVFDVLFRLLRHVYGPERVAYVRNITDVDDKINARAAAESIPIRELTERTTRQFHADVAALGCLQPTHEPRATEFIHKPDAPTDMVRLIGLLIERGHAYEAEGHVLFDVPSMPHYGRLSNRSLDEMIAGARVDVAPYKRDPMDFVLWKPSAPELPGWESPWGRGRPGWHIECSAMAMKYLGASFDIHAGGIDLQFPHHENEIAQSEGATEKLFAKYWLHGEFLKVDSEKMSKSLGNDFTLRDIINRGFKPLAIRYLLFSVPYDKQLNFTFENLKGAETTVERLRDFKKRLQEAVLPEGVNPDLQSKVRGFLEDFETAMDDNLNTSVALAALHNLVREVNTALANETVTNKDRSFVLHTIDKFDSVFGIFGASQEEILDSEIEQLIEERQEARRNRNFARSDEIRDLLANKGIILEDTKDGMRWKRK